MKKTLALTTLVATLGCGAASPAEDARNELGYIARVSLQVPQDGVCNGGAMLTMQEDMYTIECGDLTLTRNFTAPGRCDDVLTFNRPNGDYFSFVDLGCGGIADYCEVGNNELYGIINPALESWREDYSKITEEMNLEGADLQWRIWTARQRR